MAIALRQSTAGQEIPLGQFIDTDGVVTTPTLANTDIKIWKTGATTLANKNSGGATNISNGVQYAVLDATDTDTLGPLVVFVFVSGSLPVQRECVVLSANNYDSAIAATDNLQVDTVQFAGQTVTAGAGVTMPATVASTTNITAGTITTATNVTTVNGLAANVITAAAIATGAIDADAIADNAIDAGAIATGAITNAKFAAGAIDAAALAADAGTEIAAAVLAAATAAPIAADIQAVNAVTIVGNGAGTPWGP
jgi:hypothetical protein